MHHATPETEGTLIHWSRTYDVLLGPFIRRTDATILDLAQVGPGDRVLDVGTGPGFLARSAASRVGTSGEAVGVDTSPEMVARATAVTRRESLPARFVEAGAQDMPFDDGTFDVAVSRLAMHHLPGDLRDRALTEVARVLKPGGRLVVADMRSHSLAGALHDLVRHAHGRRTHAENPLGDLIERAGFTDLETGSIGMLAYVKARKPLAQGAK